MTGLMTGLAIAAAVGCGSAYQATYDQEMRNLEADQAAQQKQAQEEAARRAAAQASALDEVRRYHAVVYFNAGSAMIYEDGYRELLWFVDKIKLDPVTIWLPTWPHANVVSPTTGSLSVTAAERSTLACSGVHGQA